MTWHTYTEFATGHHQSRWDKTDDPKIRRFRMYFIGDAGWQTFSNWAKQTCVRHFHRLGMLCRQERTSYPSPPASRDRDVAALLAGAAGPAPAAGSGQFGQWEEGWNDAVGLDRMVAAS